MSQSVFYLVATMGWAERVLGPGQPELVGNLIEHMVQLANCPLGNVSLFQPVPEKKLLL